MAKSRKPANLLAAPESKVINAQQLGGIETSVLDNDPSRHLFNRAISNLMFTARLEVCGWTRIVHRSAWSVWLPGCIADLLALPLPRLG